LEQNKQVLARLWVVFSVLLAMPSAPVDYQALYDKALLEQEKALQKIALLEEKAEQAQHIAQQKQQQAEALISELTEKLTLSLDLRCTILSAGPFELDRLRRKLFGQSSDNRTKFIDPNRPI
jgi:23S rRNA pseudoU1915 N3-methylase RlmH